MHEDDPELLVETDTMTNQEGHPNDEDEGHEIVEEEEGHDEEDNEDDVPIGLDEELEDIDIEIEYHNLIGMDLDIGVENMIDVIEDEYDKVDDISQKALMKFRLLKFR